MAAFSERQRAELRDAAARSRATWETVRFYRCMYAALRPLLGRRGFAFAVFNAERSVLRYRFGGRL